jgi:thioester reductase-like protein
VAIFITGCTGFLGSYVVARLLRQHDERLLLLVRSKSKLQAEQRLWHALQLHMDFDEFSGYLRRNVELFLGDITEPRCGLTPQAYERLIDASDSVIHIAASLNRRSERTCANVNLRGTLEVINLARAAHERHGLRRFSDVSTTAVAGERNRELVQEDAAIDWQRRDYDPYARTKKFCEHMVETLLPDVPTSVFRPSTVIGDSRSGATTQFDMLRALLSLARAKLLPLRPDARHDIVPADYVGQAIADIHLMHAPRHRIYHLSAGEGAETHRTLMQRMEVDGRRLPHVFVPGLEKPFGWAVNRLASTPRALGLSRPASLLKVFWPYVVFDTVFDNRRVVQELGYAPPSFVDYATPVLEFALRNGFEYPYQPWPEAAASATEVSPSPL